MSNTRKGAAGALAAAIAALLATNASATEPCGDFGECKVLIEINSSDGDIGFHFLADADDLISASLFNPDHRRIFSYRVRRELRKQRLTETFAESSEPPCFDVTMDDDPENDDEDFVTLADFLSRWDDGTYRFFGISADWDLLFGESELTFDLPAAPAEVEWEFEEDDGDVEAEISWQPGDDLGECSNGMDMLPTHPENVPVKAWEVVVEPDVDGDLSGMTYKVRIPGNAAELEVEVPDDYLETLPPNTPVKVEVGAIGFDDNATFTEIDEICVNEIGEDGCGFEEEE